MSAEANPKVSIIIPTYNRPHYLPGALESALTQTYPNIEVLVVNDGSTDNTEQVLAPYMKQIRYIKRENGGCAAAKNTGLELATGELITNLDDDDRILPEKIERQVEVFMQRPNLGLCATGVNFIDAAGQVTERYIPPRLSPKTQVIELLRKCVLIQSSVLIHRKCHEHLGNYKLTHVQDYNFWLRTCLHYEVRIIEDVLTEYRVHGNQITGPDNRQSVKAAVRRIVKDFMTHASMEEIIPGIRSYPEGHAILGLALCEQRLFTQARNHLALALPNPAGHLGLGVLKLHQNQFDEAKFHFERVKTADSPLASKGEEGLMLVPRVEAIAAKTTAYQNTSPEVVQLRDELALFRTSLFRQLLRLARGEKQ
jgi:hypothetical protein